MSNVFKLLNYSLILDNYYRIKRMRFQSYPVGILHRYIHLN
jgi:hypothetical protein